MGEQLEADSNDDDETVDDEAVSTSEPEQEACDKRVKPPPIGAKPVEKENPANDPVGKQPVMKKRKRRQCENEPAVAPDRKEMRGVLPVAPERKEMRSVLPAGKKLTMRMPPFPSTDTTGDEEEEAHDDDDDGDDDDDDDDDDE